MTRSKRSKRSAQGRPASSASPSARSAGSRSDAIRKKPQPGISLNLAWLPPYRCGSITSPHSCVFQKAPARRPACLRRLRDAGNALYSLVWSALPDDPILPSIVFQGKTLTVHPSNQYNCFYLCQSGKTVVGGLFPRKLGLKPPTTDSMPPVSTPDSVSEMREALVVLCPSRIK